MAQAPAPQTHVVTCFILRRGPEGDAVLLVRRSDRVRTYRGAWAAVSGYLEAGITPLEQAYTELREEAGLGSADVALLATGSPLSFHDSELDQSWVVHPFLFAVVDARRMRTDWEATESRWVRPEEVSKYATVPMLAEALARVYPPQEAEDDAH